MSVLSYDTFYLELHENIEQHPVQCQVLQSSPKPRFLWIHSGMLLAQHLSYIYKFIIKEDVYGFRVCISRMISTHVQTISLPKYTKLQKINSDKTFPISFAKYASQGIVVVIGLVRAEQLRLEERPASSRICPARPNINIASIMSKTIYLFTEELVIQSPHCLWQQFS